MAGLARRLTNGRVRKGEYWDAPPSGQGLARVHPYRPIPNVPVKKRKGRVIPNSGLGTGRNPHFKGPYQTPNKQFTHRY